MNFDLKKFFLIAEKFSSRIHLFNFGLFVIAVSALSIFFPFPLHEFFVAFLSLFFSGFLFYRLIIKTNDFVEIFVLSVVLSMGIIVFSTFILNAVFNFPLNRITITSAGVFSCVIFLGLHYLKRFLSE